MDKESTERETTQSAFTYRLSFSSSFLTLITDTTFQTNGTKWICQSRMKSVHTNMLAHTSLNIIFINMLRCVRVDRTLHLLAAAVCSGRSLQILYPAFAVTCTFI